MNSFQARATHRHRPVPQRMVHVLLPLHVRRLLLVVAMVAVHVLVALTVHVSGGRSDAEYQTAFTGYLREQNKVYATEVLSKRFQFFKQKLDWIDAENSQREHTYTVGLNLFSDQTDAEVQQQFGLVLPADHAKETEQLMKSSSPRMTAAVAQRDFDWRAQGLVAPVKNQGSCGSCYTFAATAAMEGAHAVATGKVTSMAEQELLDCATTSGCNGGCNGGLPSACVSWASTNGMVADTNYKYVAKKGTCRMDQAGSVVMKPTKFVRIAANRETTDMLDAVSKSPIAVCVYASSSWLSYRSGIYNNAAGCTGRSNHAVAVVGWGHDAATNSDYWIVRNSYGTNFGERGYIRMKMGVNMCNIAADCPGYVIDPANPNRNVPPAPAPAPAPAPTPAPTPAPPNPTPQPQPSPSPTPQPQPTPTPKPKPTPTPQPAPTPSPTPSPTCFDQLGTWRCVMYASYGLCDASFAALRVREQCAATCQQCAPAVSSRGTTNKTRDQDGGRPSFPPGHFRNSSAASNHTNNGADSGARANMTNDSHDADADAEDGEEVAVTCADESDSCAQWAAAGECEVNSSSTFMFLHCRKSCAACRPAVPDAAACVDSDSNQCTRHAENGDCGKDAVARACPLSCRRCRSAPARGPGSALLLGNASSTCVDSDPTWCPMWAANGECANNPDYMTVFCASSCHQPCGGGGGDLNAKDATVFAHNTSSPLSAYSPLALAIGIGLAVLVITLTVALCRAHKRGRLSIYRHSAASFAAGSAPTSTDTKRGPATSTIDVYRASTTCANPAPAVSVARASSVTSTASPGQWTPAALPNGSMPSSSGRASSTSSSNSNNKQSAQVVLSRSTLVELVTCLMSVPIATTSGAASSGVQSAMTTAGHDQRTARASATTTQMMSPPEYATARALPMCSTAAPGTSRHNHGGNMAGTAYKV